MAAACVELLLLNPLSVNGMVYFLLQKNKDLYPKVFIDKKCVFAIWPTGFGTFNLPAVLRYTFRRSYVTFRRSDWLRVYPTESRST